MKCQLYEEYLHLLLIEVLLGLEEIVELNIGLTGKGNIFSFETFWPAYIDFKGIAVLISHILLLFLIFGDNFLDNIFK